MNQIPKEFIIFLRCTQTQASTKLWDDFDRRAMLEEFFGCRTKYSLILNSLIPQPMKLKWNFKFVGDIQVSI